MCYMFGSCLSMRSIDISMFTASAATSMSYMFYNCQSLEMLSTPASLQTTSLTNMTYMFRSCYNMQHLDLRAFVVNTVTNMTGMFYECTGLLDLDLFHVGSQGNRCQCHCN